MRRLYCSALVAVALMPGMAVAQDAAHAVAGGGISAPGWMGMLDPADKTKGESVEHAKLAKEGNALMVTTGPAVTYWNPNNKASGDYTVKATFTEPKFQGLNDHPHPYGIVIAGNDMGTDNASYLYCAAYGSGTFIVRGMGPTPFRMNGPRGGPSPAVNKAAGVGSSVTQEIAMSVKGDKVTCSINGTEVASYNKSEVVGPGKLKSTDGVYGVRFAHNTEGTVTNLTITKP